MSRRFSPRHLLGHEKQQFPVAFLGAAQELAKPFKHSRVLARAAPRDVSRTPAFQNVGQGRRFVAIIEKLVQRNFKGSGEFLKRFHGGDGMSVFYTGDVTPEQSRTFLNFSL